MDESQMNINSRAQALYGAPTPGKRERHGRKMVIIKGYTPTATQSNQTEAILQLQKMVTAQEEMISSLLTEVDSLKKRMDDMETENDDFQEQLVEKLKKPRRFYNLRSARRK